jgi:ABC-type uncharacterized transport system permease subunit
MGMARNSGGQTHRFLAVSWLMIGFLGSKFVLEYVMSGRVHS